MSATVAFLMGSKNDFPVLKSGIKLLRDFGVSCTVRVLSAHRTPQEAVDFVHAAENDGTRVFICAAGMAAHLGGVVAAHTVRPVIGIPLASEPFNGLDATLAMLQMPPGVPVATVTAGGAGAKNAALLAIEILALNDAALCAALRTYRAEQTRTVLEADAALQKEIENL